MCLKHLDLKTNATRFVDKYSFQGSSPKGRVGTGSPHFFGQIKIKVLPHFLSWEKSQIKVEPLTF